MSDTLSGSREGWEGYSVDCWGHPCGARVCQAEHEGIAVYYALTPAGQAAIVLGDSGIPIVVADQERKQAGRSYRWITLHVAQDAARAATLLPAPLAGRVILAMALAQEDPETS